MITNNEFGKRLKECRESLGISQRELAQLSNISHANISRYEKGDHGAGREIAARLAKVFNVSAFWLIGADVPKYETEQVVNTIPVLGRVAAGKPIEAQEDVIEIIPVPERYCVDFGLKVQGESMIGVGIKDGDMVLVRQQPTLENGEVGVVEIGGEVTLKRFYRDDTKIMLLSENPEIPPILVNGKDAKQKNLRIIGKAIYYMGKVK
ncbi:MAG: transcriptional repressor LexA [Carboxydocellales bacterium]